MYMYMYMYQIKHILFRLQQAHLLYKIKCLCSVSIAMPCHLIDIHCVHLYMYMYQTLLSLREMIKRITCDSICGLVINGFL